MPSWGIIDGSSFRLSTMGDGVMSAVNKIDRCVLLGIAWMSVLTMGSSVQSPVFAANVNAQRLLNAEKEPSQWMTYGGTYSEQRFSALKKINRDNVQQLGLSWFADYDSNLSQTGTPLYI